MFLHRRLSGSNDIGNSWGGDAEVAGNLSPTETKRGGTRRDGPGRVKGRGLATPDVSACRLTPWALTQPFVTKYVEAERRTVVPPGRR